MREEMIYTPHPNPLPKGEGVHEGKLAMTQLALVIDLNVCVGCHAGITGYRQKQESDQFLRGHVSQESRLIVY